MDVDTLAGWWDAFELWVTQLWFPFQVVLVIAILLPACWWAARLIDIAVDRVSAAVSRRRKLNGGTPPVNGRTPQ